MTEMCCTRLAGSAGPKKSPKIRHLGTVAQFCRTISSQLRHVSTIGKNLLNSNTSPTCPHNMVSFSPLTTEICWQVWGTPANFNGFRVLPSLLQRRCSPEANQTLHDVWPSPGLVHYIYIFGGCCPLTEFCPGAKFTLRQSCIRLYWQCDCTALEQRASAKLCGVEQRAPSIFGRAAIMLGIDPHSTYFCYAERRQLVLYFCPMVSLVRYCNMQQ